MKNIGDYSFSELPQAYYEAGKKYAKSRAKYEMLDESKKSVLAKLMSEVIIPEWLKDSESYRERIARQSDEYKNYLLWVAQWRQEESELKYEVDSLNMLFDYYRSMNALEKAKTNIL